VTRGIPTRVSPVWKHAVSPICGQLPAAWMLGVHHDVLQEDRRYFVRDIAQAEEDTFMSSVLK